MFCADPCQSQLFVSKNYLEIFFSGVSSLHTNDTEMVVTLKKSVESSLHLVLPSQFELEEERSGNVILLLDNNVRFTSHTCFLSFSPVLKSILMNVEVRLDQPCISLPGFSESSVQHLLQFLHRGYVGKNLILLIDKVSYLSACKGSLWLRIF